MDQTHCLTLRKPPYTYLHLGLVSPEAPKGSDQDSPIDSITAYSYINAALTRFLGVHGSAISFDILKESGREVWIRVPTEDGSAVVAALAQWTSSKGEMLQVIGRSAWLSAINEAQSEKRNLFATTIN